MKTRWWIALAAGLLAGTAAAGSGCVAYASDEIRIIGESEEETAPSDQAEDAAAVLANWEAIKRKEKPERKSRLDGVPKDLPALMAAAKIQGKAADAGFDWDDVAPVFEKCREEWQELREAVGQKDAAHIEEELGDLLFAVVNLSRFLKVNAELALLAANRKFKRRFRRVEERVEAAGGDWKQFTLQELDKFWEDAKRAEANADAES